MKKINIIALILVVFLMAGMGTSWALVDVLFDFAYTPQSWIYPSTTGTGATLTNIHQVASPSSPITNNGSLAMNINFPGTSGYQNAQIQYNCFMIGNSINWWSNFTVIKVEVMLTGTMPSTTGQDYDVFMSSGGYVFREDHGQPAPVLNQWQTLTFHMSTAADPTQVRAFGVRLESSTTFNGTMYIDYIRGEGPDPAIPLVDHVVYDFATDTNGFTYAFGNIDPTSITRVASPSYPVTNNGSLQYTSQLPGPGYSEGALSRPMSSGADWSASKVYAVDYYHYIPPTAPDTTLAADMFTQSSTNYNYQDHRIGAPFTPGDWTRARLVPNDPTYGLTDPHFVRGLGDRIESNGAYNGQVNLDYVVVHEYADQRIFNFFYKKNVFAVALWTALSESTAGNAMGAGRDLSATAQLTDNHGNTFFADAATLGLPTTTIFKYKVVYKSDSTGTALSGWQNPSFDDSSWTISTGGFSIGYSLSTATDSFTLAEKNEATALDSTALTVYVRCTFDAPTAGFSTTTSLSVKLEGDDAVACWFNGQYIGYDGCPYGDNSAGVRLYSDPGQFNYNTLTEVAVGVNEIHPATYQYPHRNWTINVVPTSTNVPSHLWEVFE